jgi:hypothetical protein
LIERFYHYVIRQANSNVLFALYFDGQAEGEPRATSGTR